MKLVVLTNILGPFRMPLFEALARRVDDLTVLLMAEREENRQWELEPPRFKTRVLDGWHIRPKSQQVSTHWNVRVVKELRRLDPDVVVSAGFALANLSALWYCRRHAKTFVNWAHLSLADGAQHSGVRRWLRRLFARAADGSIAESSEAREAFIHYGADPERVCRTLLSVDVSFYNRTAAHHRTTAEWRRRRGRYRGAVLLSVGRLTASKGHRELFAIYERIIAEKPDTVLMIVGDGPERSRYEQIVKERGWQDRVEFVGFVQPDEVPRYFALADVFVFHTLRDPFGAVLSEAMAAEVPVVSSIHAASTRDLIDEGSTGFTIDPRLPDASAHTILRLLDLPAPRRAEIVRSAYARVKQHDAEHAADSIVAFLNTCTPGRAGRALHGPAPGTAHGPA